MTPPIKVTRYASPAAFITAAEPSLSATREWQNSIPIGVITEYITSPTPPPETGFTLLSTHDPSTGEICLVATQSPSYHCLGFFSAVALETLDVGAHVTAIVEALGAENLPGGFNGDARLMDVVAAAVIKARGGDTKVVDDGLVCLGTVVTPATLSPTASTPKTLPETHEIRLISYPMDEHYHDLLTSMHHDLFLEARDIDIPYESSSSTVRETVARGHAWCYFIANVPVACCYCGRATRRGKSLNYVYTRQEFRRNGYAETLVGEVCRHGFDDEGLEYVVLFFALGGAAEGVYRRVGFRGEDEYIQKDLKVV